MKLAKLVFRDKNKTSVSVFEAWEVRWYSRHCVFSSGLHPEVRVFPCKEDAKKFAKALEDAYKLIRHTSGTEVKVVKQEVE